MFLREFPRKELDLHLKGSITILIFLSKCSYLANILYIFPMTDDPHFRPGFLQCNMRPYNMRLIMRNL